MWNLVQTCHFFQVPSLESGQSKSLRPRDFGGYSFGAMVTVLVAGGVRVKDGSCPSWD